MTMRVNLGSGDYPAPGWVNVDHGTPHQHDVSADLTGELPAELADIEQAYAGHVFEHLTPAELAALLTGLRERMAPGGELMIVGPDVDRSRKLHADGVLTDEDLRLIVEGGDRWPGDRHLWESAPGPLIEALADAGWRDAREVPLLAVSPMNWPIVSHAEWQCAVTAYA